MSQVLYRKYRSKNFDELYGQDHIKDTLRFAIKNNSIAHAYLFTGPRGTGKTSTARIFAKEINFTEDQNKNIEIAASIDSGSALDIIEIDAASNRGIEEIRELREKVNFAPAYLRYKVYIIDEVHMLTKEAFNALLKTLEEPPKHVVFVLATTEIDKVPVTIISRTQRFDFKLADNNELQKKIDFILVNESKKLNQESIELIMSLGRGSFRDTETILDKVLNTVSDSKELAKTDVEKILGLANANFVESLATKILEKNIESVFSLLENMEKSGLNIKFLINQLLEELRSRMLKKVILNQGEFTNKFIVKVISNLIEANSQLRNSPIDILPMEIAVIKSLEGEEVQAVSAPVSTKLETKKPEDKVIAKEATTEVTIENKVVETKSDSNLNATSDITFDQIKGKWKDFIEAIKPFNHHLVAFIAKGELSGIKGNEIQIRVGYKFHKQRIELQKSREIINGVLLQVYGINLSLGCILDENMKKTELEDVQSDDSNESMVEEIFG